MSSKKCEICNKPSGIYPLCKDHLKLKQNGLVIKNEITNKWEIKEFKKNKNNILIDKEYEKCIICEEKSNKKPLCLKCYNEAKELEDEIDRNKPHYELKDYYFNLKFANYRIIDKKIIIRNFKMMTAISNILYDSHDDTSLISRLNNDIIDTVEIYNSKKQVKQNSFTEQSDLQKSAIMRTLDGHIVKSQGERIIDDILYNNLIIHCYEKDVYEIKTSERSIKGDWYIPVLPNKGIYLEYWGLGTDSYNKNKEEKRKLYKDNKIYLIEIEKDDIKDVSGLTSRIIKEYNTLKEIIKQSI